MTATRFTCTATFALGAALLVGCSNSPQSQVTWQSNGTPQITNQNQDWWNYQFVYYPHAQVYFEPHSQTYYWFHEGVWRQGSKLPAHYTLQNDTPRVVKLESEKPYMQHHTVASAFNNNFKPYEGSDFTTSREAFLAYVDRYEVATTEYQQQQWASAIDSFGPYGSPFQPFTTSLYTNAEAHAAATSDSNNNFDNSSYTSGSEEYHKSLNRYLNESTANVSNGESDF